MAYYEAPAWVEDGMTVWLRWDEEKGTALRCTVATAAGNHARVVNKKYSVDKWVGVDSLLVPPDDSHTRDATAKTVRKMVMGMEVQSAE